MPPGRGGSATSTVCSSSPSSPSLPTTAPTPSGCSGRGPRVPAPRPTLPAARPAAEWLLGAGPQRARAALARARGALTAYQQGRAALLERYDADVFELDGRALRTRFRRDYDEPFGDTERRYREDRAALAA